MLEMAIKKVLDAIPWVFSGVGNIVVKKIINTSANNPQTTLQDDIQPEELEIEEEPYSVRLGKRHKFLREDILKLNERQMANFYGYDLASELERYERGEDEFPKESMEKLKETFFINERFLEDGDSRIFRNFGIYSDEVKKLLKEGFRPLFLCSICDRNWLYTYPVFHKQENNYSRIVVSNSTAYFQSTGGNYNNIAQIIIEMLRQGMRYSDASILQVSKQTWQELEQGTFYSNGSLSNFSIGWDYECMDIFYEWFHDIENKNQF